MMFWDNGSYSQANERSGTILMFPFQRQPDPGNLQNVEEVGLGTHYHCKGAVDQLFDLT